jgi:hypothetical protein
MAGVEHTYSYLAPAAVTVERGHADVALATSGGKAPHPFFFSGFLGSPRQTAQTLLVVAEVARTRYYEPPQMVAARIRAADPIVTSKHCRPAPASMPGSTSIPTRSNARQRSAHRRVEVDVCRPPLRRRAIVTTPTPC